MPYNDLMPWHQICINPLGNRNDSSATTGFHTASRGLVIIIFMIQEEKSMFKKEIMKVAVAIAFSAVSAYSQAAVVDASHVRVFGSATVGNDQLYSLDPRANMTMLASTSQTLSFLGDAVGSVLDQVWKDNSTGQLSFFTRIVMDTAGYEVNDVVRAGFTGFSTDVTWFREAGSNVATQGFRLKSAGHTDSIGTATDVYKSDYINLRSDISVEEGKPTSGWYVIKTDATAFTTIVGATASAYGMFLRSTGEDVGAPASLYLSSFAPTIAVTPVPEPENMALLMAGLGLVGIAARRQKK